MKAIKRNIVTPFPVDIIHHYEQLHNRIINHIENNDFNISFLTQAIGVSRKTFYRKVKNKNFTIKEVKTISLTINDNLNNSNHV